MSLRAYLGGITTRHSLLGCIASSSARVQFHFCFRRATRSYAAASTTSTKKAPVAVIGIRKDVRTQSQPSPRKAASRTPKKTTLAEMGKAAIDSGQSKFKDQVPHNMTEEQSKELDRMLIMAQFMPTIDPWGQEVQETLGGCLRLLSHFLFKSKLLDVMIPYNVNYKSFTGETYKQIKSNLTNSFKNAFACVSGSFFSIKLSSLLFS